MLRCQTLIINSSNVDSPGLNIDGNELSIENGELKLKDNNGNIKIVGKNNSINRFSIELDDITQTINKKNEIYDIIIEDYVSITNNEYFEKGSDSNSIKFKEDGIYFIIYNLSIEQLGGGRSTSKSYFQFKKNNEFIILEETVSYGYHRTNKNGHQTLVSSITKEINKNTEMKLSVELIDGNANLKTIPNQTTIDIFKIG